MPSVEITSSWSDLGFVIASSVAMLLAIVASIRILGLRSFSKMSSFDFAVTVATGSILASVALTGSSLAEGVVAVGALFAVQWVIATGRTRFAFSKTVDNQPLLLMVGSRFLEENLHRSRVTADDVRAKLREANVLNYSDVRYVVLETTGDVSVVHGPGKLERYILADVAEHGIVFDEA